jgi:hypothetical protein
MMTLASRSVHAGNANVGNCAQQEHQIARNAWLKHRARRAAMEPAGTASRRFPSKFLLTVIPGLVASGVAASVLYAVHVSRAPSTSEYLSEPMPQNDGLSAEERRDLTRQMLKARRENQQEPAQVQPLQVRPMSAPAAARTADLPMDADAGAVADVKAPEAKAAEVKPFEAKAPEIKAPEAKVADTKATEVRPADTKIVVRAAPDRPALDKPDHAVAVAPLPAARPPVARPRPDAAAAVTPVQQPLPPAASGALPPPALATTAPAGPMQIGPPPGAGQPSVTANAPPSEPEQPRGIAGHVFSGLSSIAGSAANATGNTVNWVINLPGKAVDAGGKAISAGGKLIGIESKDNQQAETPPATAPPAAAPPPARRNF